ncbi:MAG: hypothetical protein U0412_08090 [Nitrospira sp.]
MTFLRRLTVLTVALALVPSLGSALGEKAAPVVLFWQSAGAEPGQAPLPNKKPWLLREQEIALDGTLVQILKDATARPLPPIVVDFFDAGRFELDVFSTLSRINDTSIVRGQLKPPGRSDFTIVITGTTVAATFPLSHRLFKIESLGNGRHRLIEVDPEQSTQE